MAEGACGQRMRRLGVSWEYTVARGSRGSRGLHGEQRGCIRHPLTDFSKFPKALFSSLFYPIGGKRE